MECCRNNSKLQIIAGGRFSLYQTQNGNADLCFLFLRDVLKRKSEKDAPEMQIFFRSNREGTHRRAYATVHAILCFWCGFLSSHQVSMNSCQLVLRGDSLVDQYLSAMFSCELCQPFLFDSIGGPRRARGRSLFKK